MISSSLLQQPPVIFLMAGSEKSEIQFIQESGAIHYSFRKK